MRFAIPALFVTFAATAALAEEITFPTAEVFRNARHDPSHIWADADMTAFGPYDRGATVTEFRATAADGATWIVSQIKNAECSSHLCPTRLVREASDGGRRVYADDLMQIGGHFSLNGSTLSDGSGSFPVEPGRK